MVPTISRISTHLAFRLERFPLDPSSFDASVNWPPSPFDPPTIRLPSLAERQASGGDFTFPAQPGGLPTGITETTAPCPEEALLKQRLTAVLEGTLEGLNLAVAEMRVLDNASHHLRAELVCGNDTPQQTRWSLAEAAADITIMAGDAVVLDSASDIRQTPGLEGSAIAGCGSAIGVPIASDDKIHGVLWLGSQLNRTFTAGDQQIAEIVAGRLAVERERAELKADGDSVLAIAEAAAVPANTITPSLNESLNGAWRALAPVAAPTAPDLEELEFAGWAVGSGGAFYDWLTLADGRHLVMAGMPFDTPGGIQTESLFAAHAARISAKSHALHSETAGELLDRVADTVWNSTSGGEALSMAVCLIDSEFGAGSYALAGDAATIRVRASQRRVTVDPNTPLGLIPDQPYRNYAFELAIRERLLLFVGDDRTIVEPHVDDLANRFKRLTAETHRRMTAAGAVKHLRTTASGFDPLGQQTELYAIAGIRRR